MIQCFGSSVEPRALMFEPTAGCEALGAVFTDFTRWTVRRMSSHDAKRSPGWGSTNSYRTGDIAYSNSCLPLRCGNYWNTTVYICGDCERELERLRFDTTTAAVLLDPLRHAASIFSLLRTTSVPAGMRLGQRN